MAVKTNVVGGATMQPDGKLVPFMADKGDTGGQGLSAYQIWLAAGNIGTEAQYLASLKSTAPGPTGSKGWSPVFAGELDGVRTLFKLVDWTGGEGTKPDVGMYVGSAGYVTAKVQAFNFNTAKRVMMLQAQTNASGVATFDFTAYAFASTPAVVALPATTALLSGPTRSTVSGTSKTGTTVTVQQQAILTGVVSLLAGATANILVVEQ